MEISIESKDFPFTLAEVETDPVTRFYSSGVMSAEEKDRLTALLEKDFRIEYFETYNVKAKPKVSGIPPFPSECKFSMDPIFIASYFTREGPVPVSLLQSYDIALYSLDDTKPIVYYGFFGEPVNKDLYAGSIISKFI
jgi:hypothetical protein